MKIKKVRTLMGVLLNEESRVGIQLKSGDLLEGAVLKKEGSALYIDVSPYGTGMVFGREYRMAKDLIRGLQPGAKVVAKIIDPENDQGYVELSLHEAGREKSWEQLAELKSKNQTVLLAITEANRGGLIVEYEGIQGFLPVSQLSSKHYPRVKDGDKAKILSELQKFIGQKLGVKVITVSPKEEKLVVSEKEVELEQLSDVLAQYKVGDIIEGEVSGVVDFGAFVRFRGVASAESTEAGADGRPELEGLIHISELDYKLVTNPADIVRVGDQIKAKIIAIEHGRVSLSLKRLKEDPWDDIDKKYAKGDLVQGKVIKRDRYGVLVELIPGVHGLCHVSELAASEEVETGVSYPFRILDLVPPERKLILSFLRRTPYLEGAAATAAVEDATARRGGADEGVLATEEAQAQGVVPTNIGATSR
ncbi:MAG: S1 RNA-binding domain-containing protein [bacterium]|nr:S1 RNA-binding domain-containing protein [bacterium]MDZ4296248.1 S1 RNA-binding domain-containing protein [Patescibacteria group bacterium]